jgi:hypothetical protein
MCAASTTPQGTSALVVVASRLGALALSVQQVSVGRIGTPVRFQRSCALTTVLPSFAALFSQLRLLFPRNIGAAAQKRQPFNAAR